MISPRDLLISINSLDKLPNKISNLKHINTTELKTSRRNSKKDMDVSSFPIINLTNNHQPQFFKDKSNYAKPTKSESK
jgi:hypothetical protein